MNFNIHVLLNHDIFHLLLYLDKQGYSIFITSFLNAEENQIIQWYFKIILTKLRYKWES